jgi:hypothetical protein
MEWSVFNQLILQEDRSISSDAAWGTQEATIWSVDPATGKAIRFAQVDRTAVPFGQTDAQKTNIGNWETSGATDVSDLYGNQTGTDYIFDVQAHSVLDGAISAGRLVEGGQLIRLTSATTPNALRLLDPVTGFHLTTTSASEASSLVGKGWRNEGVSFVVGDAGIASAGNFKQLFRLYNAATGDRLLTTDTNEISAANRSGYVTEGIAGRIQTVSILGASTAVNRLYNGREHLLSSNAAEITALVSGGWKNEGVIGFVA